MPIFYSSAMCNAALIRKVGSTTVINLGSLGQPKTGKPDGCYAVWHDDHFELKRFPQPHRETIMKLRQLPISQEVKHDLKAVLASGSLPA